MLLTGAYFAVGSLVYYLLEGWSPLDSVYFMLVTSTTVGYGDFSPVSQGGRLFTSGWALLGITLVFSAIQPLADNVLRLRGRLEKTLVDFLPFLREAELPDSLDIPIEEFNKTINYPRRFFLAVSGPLMLLLVMLAAGPLLIGLSIIDSIYFAIISMATIGYGDIAPSNSVASQIFAVVFLPLAVTALAQSLQEVSLIMRRRLIRETDLKLVADQILIEEAKGDPNETLTEAEFLISVLVKQELVDSDTLLAIRRQFFHLTNKRAWNEIDGRVLDSKLVFLELVSQGRIKQSLSHPWLTFPHGRQGRQEAPHTVGETPAADETEMEVDLGAMDGGYAEWHDSHWIRLVQEGNGGLLRASGPEGLHTKIVTQASQAPKKAADLIAKAWRDSPSAEKKQRAAELL